MAVNAWADSDYYVDSNGIMVTDKWLKTTSDGGEEENGTILEAAERP